MESALLDWLARTGSRAFSYSLAAFVLVNGAAIAAVVITRDRSLVNRWTGRILAANLVLAGTGLGIPMLTSMARLGVLALSPRPVLTTPMADKASEAGVVEMPLEAVGRR